ncbi:ubiquitin-specific protease ubp2 [Physocladia obscura]|uniref:Ubiquitin-specific protease ubp2 n=1 Tax=Physocladia obscura TaxID=109957 RepID=A0AAD5XJA0_9FUNG|nr:ubiquitin-specific protease ubp2 [Physocladia obscura]
MSHIGFKFNSDDGFFYPIAHTDLCLNAESLPGTDTQYFATLAIYEELLLLEWNLKIAMQRINNDPSPVDYNAGPKIFFSWLGVEAPKRATSDRFDEFQVPLLELHYTRLGCLDDVSDEILKQVFLKQLEDNPKSKSLYLDSLIQIANSRNSYSLSEFIAMERTTRKLHTSDELISAYTLLKLPVPPLQNLDASPTQKLAAKNLVEIFTVCATESPFLIDDLRAAVKIVATEEGYEDVIELFLETGSTPSSWTPESFESTPDLIPDINRPIGLQNFGVLCYLNSLVQFYATIKPLREAVLQVSDTNEKSVFLLHLKTIFAGLSFSPANISSIAIDRAFAVAVLSGNIANSATASLADQNIIPVADSMDFEGPNPTAGDVLLNVQQDCGEFMDVFMEMVEKGFKALGDDSNAHKIKELFFGKTVQTVQYKTILGISHSDTMNDEFLYLIVNLAKDLRESLDAYFSPITVDYEKKKALKTIRVKELPPILTIKLRRVQYDLEKRIAVKSNEFVQFQDEISLEQYFLPPDNLRTRNYRIHAVLQHEGEASYGHYRIFIRDYKVEGKWFEYNDARVTVVNDPQNTIFGDTSVRAGNAYFLVYVDSERLGDVVETFYRKIEK